MRICLDPRQTRDVLPPTDEEQGIEHEEMEYEIDTELHQLKEEEGTAITDGDWMTKYLNSNTNSKLSANIAQYH